MSNSNPNKTIIRNKALDLLANREHTKLELQRKLSAKGFTINEIDEVVEKLAEQGLQSNQRFLESYVNMRANRGFGPVRIKQELYERGISKDLLQQSNIFSTFDWQDLLQKARKKKFGSALPQNFQEKSKQMRYLVYKGFDFGRVSLICAPQL